MNSLRLLGERITSDSKWKFIERDYVKFALRLGLLTPPAGASANQVLPHNEDWAIFKERQERDARKKKASVEVTGREANVSQEPTQISPNVDRSKKKKKNDPAVGAVASGSGPSVFQRVEVPKRPRSGPTASAATTSQPVDVDEIDRIPLTQSSKIQPLSAMTEVELNKDEKNRVRKEAINRCLVDQFVLRIPIKQFHVPSTDTNWEKWGPYQIRACNKSFVLELKKHMQTNAYAHYHNFILLVDPQDCPDKSRWKFPPPSSWKFYVIGGNHSALARMELLAQYPGIYKHFRHCNYIIYAGLTKSEAALFAHDDNFDAEVRRKYTFHQRVEYFHRQFMEAKQTGESMASLRKRLALETVNIVETDSKTSLSTLENTFQVAFTAGKLWEVQESIFRKWERRELKSMKAVGKGKKKDDGEMRQTWWRALQSVFDDRKMSILLRVDSGELALDQMTAECERCRTLDVIMKAFCHLTGCNDWEEAQAKCGPFSSDERLYSYEKSFELMLKLPDAKTEVTRGHKHSTEVAPPQNDSDAAMNEVIVESEDDEAILLHRDDENNEDNEENDPAEGPVGEDENPEDAEETSDQAERQDDPVDVVPDSLTGGPGDAE
ncbi:hypothetical protein R1sor_014303 [Riccia sorocarpa]|uniref:Uncharacterized protein n=1 Tax=Riccia sorocarpa TaxID=122646 RepID=A0ABD3HF47_9MARC